MVCYAGDDGITIAVPPMTGVNRLPIIRAMTMIDVLLEREAYHVFAVTRQTCAVED